MRIPSVAICTLAVLTAQDLDHQGYAASPDDLPGQAATQKAASSPVVPVIAAPVVPPETVAVAQTVILAETIAPVASTEIQVAERTVVPVVTPATVVPSETVVAEKVAPAPVSPTGQAAPTPVSPIAPKSTAAPEVTPENFLPPIKTDSDAPKEVSPRLDPSEKTITSSLPTPSNTATAVQPALDVGKPPDPTLIATAPLAPKPDSYVIATAPVRVDPTIKSDTPITDQNLPLPQWATQVRACMAAPEKIVINANGRSVCPPSDPVATAPTELPPRFRLAPGFVVVPTSPVPAVRPTPQAPALDGATLYQTAREAVVLVETKYATGSGFIVRSDGLIITNAHVVAELVAGEKEAIKVYIEGEKTPVFAELIGFDYQGADLALLKVPRNRRPLLLAKTIQIGEPAFAIGSPFALDLNLINLITDGIVSGVTEGQVITNVLTNKGNSGGPLLNSQGEVIGVTTFNFSGDGSAVGIKFGVNVKRVKKFLEAALAGRSAIVDQHDGRKEKPPTPFLKVGSTVFGRLDNEDSARLAEFDQDDPKNSVLSKYESYQFEGRKGKRITIEVKAIKENEEGFMPQLMIVRRLNDGEKQILPASAQNKELDSTLEFQVPEDGTYFLTVGSSKKGEGGSYKLTVK